MYIVDIQVHFFLFKLIWKNLLFLQIIPQRDAGGHDGGELDVVHDVGAGVSTI